MAESLLKSGIEMASCAEKLSPIQIGIHRSASISTDRGLLRSDLSMNRCRSIEDLQISIFRSGSLKSGNLDSSKARLRSSRIVCLWAYLKTPPAVECSPESFINLTRFAGWKVAMTLG